VYDGDTITVAAKLTGLKPWYRFHVRLAGIDTPEMKSANEIEKKVARQAQQALSELILGKTVRLENRANEKYGRLLADVYLEELHVNKWLLDQRLAVPYDGKTKSVVDDWQAYRDGVRA
jgi:endonuclease YncB( thermonuclease family)